MQYTNQEQPHGYSQRIFDPPLRVPAGAGQPERRTTCPNFIQYLVSNRPIRAMPTCNHPAR